MAAYYIDILEPDDDLNVALDNLSRDVAPLYAKDWEQNERKLHEDKPFDLHIQALIQMWMAKHVKIFVMYDEKSQEAIGFLAGNVFRPMAYNATVFQVQAWYTADDAQMEKDLFAHVVSAIRILGCDEFWTQGTHDVPLGPTWTLEKAHPVRRYLRKR